jgi:hypothetical protein
MIYGVQVKLHEECGTVQLIEELLDHRDQELILDGLVVESSVVDTKPP